MVTKAIRDFFSPPVAKAESDEQKKRLLTRSSHIIALAQEAISSRDIKNIELYRSLLDDITGDINAFKLIFSEDKEILALASRTEAVFHQILSLQCSSAVSTEAAKATSKKRARDAEATPPPATKKAKSSTEKALAPDAPKGIVRDGGIMNCFLISTYQLLDNAGLLSQINDKDLASWKDFDGDCQALRESFSIARPGIISPEHHVQEDATEVLNHLIAPSAMFEDTDHIFAQIHADARLTEAELAKLNTENVRHYFDHKYASPKQAPALWDSVVERTFDVTHLPSKKREEEKSSKTEEKQTVLTLNLAKDKNQFPKLLANRLNDSAKTTKEDAIKVPGSKRGKQLILQKTTIVTPPRELFISLSRFEYDSKEQHAHKNTAEVKDIPFELTLPKANVQHGSSHKYNLHGFIIHEGDCGGGHYYAVVCKNGAWFKCDDDDVKKLTKAEVEKLLPHAYILHYSKKP